MFVVRSFGGVARCCRAKTRMPLKAKLVNPAFAAGKAQMATSSTSQGDRPAHPPIKELPGDEKEDVLFNTLYGLRTIELNRPKKLNSLDGSMIRKILPRLQEWAKSDMANVIVIKGAGKGFCAGGDVTALAKDNMEDWKGGPQRSSKYFALEYKLNHLIATYSKPYVAFMDGATMGGGVGLSIHAPFRIATENTRFAMPETTIGFFPDVGASFFLPRMPGAVGTYLALTSQELKGVNAYYAGVATHYIHSSSLHALERRLAELRFNDYDPLEERLELINSTIEEYSSGLPHDVPILLSGELRKFIDKTFGADSVLEVIELLTREAETVGTQSETPMAKWSKETLESLDKRSPTSIFVSFRQMKLGRRWSIAETFQREHLIATKFMSRNDFKEGVDALLIRKDKRPRWNPDSFYEVDEMDKNEQFVDSFFKAEGKQRLQLLNDHDYQEYPHFKYGVPQERHIEQFIKQGGKMAGAVVKHFVSEKNGKLGVKEVVEDVLNRKTAEQEDKTLIWV